MKCPIKGPGGTEVLLAYASNRLPVGARLKIEQHMEACSACQATFREHRALWRVLDQWQPGPVSKDFDHRLFERIAQGNGAALADWILPSPAGQRIRRAAPILAAGLLVLSVLRFLTRF